MSTDVGLHPAKSAAGVAEVDWSALIRTDTVDSYQALTVVRGERDE